jgi:hypothetical protein
MPIPVKAGTARKAKLVKAEAAWKVHWMIWLAIHANKTSRTTDERFQPRVRIAYNIGTRSRIPTQPLRNSK